MQSCVFAFVFINVHGDFLHQVQGFAVDSLEAFQISRDDVVGFSGRNPLREFAQVVGDELPLWLFILGAADLDRNSIDRTIIREN